MSQDSFKNSAHDLNNILTSIVNSVELLKQTVSSNDDVTNIITGLEKSVNRAKDILHSHLSPDNSNRKKIERVNIYKLVEEVIESFSKNEKELFEINTNDNSYCVLIDSTDLYRMIQNLVKNSLEAIESNGIIKIDISLVNITGRKFVSVKVIDNGEGIPQNNLSKLFEPKFSTKNKVQESGYGLASVKEKVEEYGGNVEVESHTGKTIFTLTLPLLENKKDNSYNVLLAEDDESVSEVLADLLKSQGYNVIVAKTGVEAINEMKQLVFDALIIDKKMPEMDGIECIKAIRSYNREIPIILASGSEINIISNELNYLNIGWVIKKPYNFPEILSALQKFNL